MRVHERRFLSSVRVSLRGASSRSLPLAATAGVAEVSGPRDRTRLEARFLCGEKKEKKETSLNGREVKLDIPQLSCDVSGHRYGEG